MLQDNLILEEWMKCQKEYGQLYFMMIKQGSIIIKDKTMKFQYFIRGERPPSGYSLIFGMHGGGGCPTPINEQQYQNHLALYNNHLPNGVIWFVMRSCEQASDMWWKSYLPDFLSVIIKGFVLKEIVNANKIFVTGYSAGGDGVYHIGPMLADWLAGAAMMAGHPNNVEIYNIRNLAFSIQVGGKDEAYNRNNEAKKYIEHMKKYSEEYGGFQTKYCHVFEDCQHWMNLKDASMFTQFLQEQRNPYPCYILFKQHPRLKKQYFYYLEVNPDQHKELIVVCQYGNQFYIQSQKIAVNIYVNQKSVDFSQEVKIYHNSTLTVSRRPERNWEIVTKTIEERTDPYYIFEDCLISIPDRDRVPLASDPQISLKIDQCKNKTGRIIQMPLKKHVQRPKECCSFM